jgi:hypothetical protein
MDHTIDASERRASALVPMGIEFFLGENITACLSQIDVSNDLYPY